MSFESSLLTWLKNNLPLAGNRVYAVLAPQDVSTPYIVYTLISAPRDYTHDGPSGIVEARYQFNLCAETYAGAKAMADQLRGTLSGFSGLFESVTVFSAMLDTELDSHEDNADLYVIFCDYIISYKE